MWYEKDIKIYGSKNSNSFKLLFYILVVTISYDLREVNKLIFQYFHFMGKKSIRFSSIGSAYNVTQTLFLVSLCFMRSQRFKKPFVIMFRSISYRCLWKLTHV